MPTKVSRRSATIELAGAEVPSIFLLPDVAHPVPGALLLHGYSSSKERLAETMGRALAARGIASLAIDLPLHGSRDDAMIEEARTNPLGRRFAGHAMDEHGAHDLGSALDTCFPRGRGRCGCLARTPASLTLLHGGNQ